MFLYLRPIYLVVSPIPHANANALISTTPSNPLPLAAFLCKMVRHTGLDSLTSISLVPINPRCSLFSISYPTSGSFTLYFSPCPHPLFYFCRPQNIRDLHSARHPNTCGFSGSMLKISIFGTLRPQHYCSRQSNPQKTPHLLFISTNLR